MLALAFAWVPLVSVASVRSDVGEILSRPLGLPLLQAGVNEVEELLGAGTAGDEEPFVCYVAPRKHVFIRFLLDPYPRTNRRTSGFTMRTLSGATAAPCAVLGEEAEARVSFSVGGIELGMDRDEVVRLLGPGEESPDGRVFRYFTGPVALSAEQRRFVPRTSRDAPDDGPVERTVVISARFHDDKLAELSVMASWRMLAAAR